MRGTWPVDVVVNALLGAPPRTELDANVGRRTFLFSSWGGPVKCFLGTRAVHTTGRIVTEQPPPTRNETALTLWSELHPKQMSNGHISWAVETGIQWQAMQCEYMQPVATGAMVGQLPAERCASARRHPNKACRTMNVLNSSGLIVCI